MAAYKPLQGMRILSAEQYGAGPYGSMQLADLGAEVIKIENPHEGGDVSRLTGPYFLGEDPNQPDSLFFQSLNRNKKSLTLDLKKPDGQATLKRLAAQCDAVMNNLRGDLPDRLGLTYAALKDANPKLVCVHLSAYGRHNDRAAWPGYDYLMQAEAGFLHLTGEPSSPPTRMGLSVVDFMTGMTTAMSLLAGVWGAQRHNRGCDIDISLFDVALAQLNYPAAWFLNEGHTIERMPRSAHPSTVPCELVPCADGWLFVMCMTPKFWRTLAEGVGKPAWLADPRFVDAASRRKHRLEMTAELEAVFKHKAVADWMALFAGKLPAAPVLNLAQALTQPFALSQGMVEQVPHPHAPQQKLVASPIRIEGQRPQGKACSALGADTAQLLGDMGWSADEISRLKQEGVI
jgi:crotonobetainyl-CoA:carnitine CoA-transferase CaiB-like acyl-CoA transferase